MATSKLLLTPIKVKENQYMDFLENLKRCFKNFSVLKPGVLNHRNVLIIADSSVPKEEMEKFVWKLSASLEAVGILVNHFYVSIIENVDNKEDLLKFTQLFPDIGYFLLIGSDNSYHGILKWLKLKMDTRGNYKDYRKLIPLCDWFKVCLEINKQCRGLNYLCPPNFPCNTVFVHFKISKWQISCGTNATKFVNPDVMLSCCNAGEFDYVEKLEHICGKLTGKLERKKFQQTIITFENCLQFIPSVKIASELYEVAAKFLTWTKIGVAEVSLKPTGIKTCIAMAYDDGMDSAEILKNLNMCRNCNEIRLDEDEESDLPEQINRCNTHFSNLTANYKSFNFVMKYQPSENDFDEAQDIDLPQKIKHRNHVLQNVEDFSIIEDDKWHRKRRNRK